MSRIVVQGAVLVEIVAAAVGVRTALQVAAASVTPAGPVEVIKVVGDAVMLLAETVTLC